MASIEKATARFGGDDELTVEFEVAHPVHESGAWFNDTITVRCRRDHRIETISRSRQVDVSLTSRAVYSVTGPVMKIDRSWEPIAVTVRTSPIAPTGARCADVVVEADQ